METSKSGGNFWSWDLIHFLPKMQHLPQTKVQFWTQKRVRKNNFQRFISKNRSKFTMIARVPPLRKTYFWKIFFNKSIKIDEYIKGIVFGTKIFSSQKKPGGNFWSWDLIHFLPKMQHLPHTKVPFWMQRRVSICNFQRFISRNLSKFPMTARFWKFLWTNRSKLGITSRHSSSVKRCFLVLQPKECKRKIQAYIELEDVRKTVKQTCWEKVDREPSSLKTSLKST